MSNNTSHHKIWDIIHLFRILPVVGGDEADRLVAVPVRKARDEEVRRAVGDQLLVAAVGAVRAPDQQPVEAARPEQIQITALLFKFGVVELEQEVVAAFEQRPLKSGQHIHEVIVGEGVVSVGLRRDQEPDDAGLLLEQPLRVDVGHVIERTRRLEDPLPGLLLNFEVAAVVQHLRYRAGREPHVTRQVPDAAACLSAVHGDRRFLSGWLNPINMLRGIIP